jgi:hypothetical protein
MIRVLIENYTNKRAAKAKRKLKNIFTANSLGGIDDEYYINEIIGIEELPYSEWAKDAN